MSVVAMLILWQKAVYALPYMIYRAPTLTTKEFYNISMLILFARSKKHVILNGLPINELVETDA